MSIYFRPRNAHLEPIRPDLWPQSTIDRDGNVYLETGPNGISDTLVEQVEKLLAQLMPDSIFQAPVARITQIILPPPYTRSSINFIDSYRAEPDGWGAEPLFLNTSRSALDMLQQKPGQSGPTDIRFSPHTWLPSNLGASIAEYEPGNLDSVRDVTQVWLQGHSEALFGERFDDQTQPQRLRFVDASNYLQADSNVINPVLANTAYARYQQWHPSDGSWWPVYGGEVSVRVAQTAQDDSNRFGAVATNSFFPIPPNLSFAANPDADPEHRIVSPYQAILTAKRCLADVIENPRSLSGLYRALEPQVSENSAGQVETQDLVDALQQLYERRRYLLEDTDLHVLLREKAQSQEPGRLLTSLWNANARLVAYPFGTTRPDPEYISDPDRESTYANALAPRWFDPMRTTEPFAITSLELLCSRIEDPARHILVNYVVQLHDLENQAVVIGSMLKNLVPEISQDEVERTVEMLWKTNADDPLPEWQAGIVPCQHDDGVQDRWILPFGGEYHLVYVVELTSPSLDDGWRVFVDAQAPEGRVLGSLDHLLWQNLAYYKKSGDLLGNPPTSTIYAGNSNDLSNRISKFADVHWHANSAPGEPAVDFAAIAAGANPVLTSNPQAGIDAVSVAVHAHDMFVHLVEKVGIPADTLRSYADNGHQYKPKIKIGKTGSDLQMGFFAAQTFHPATITFQSAPPSGDPLSSADELVVFAPSQDREVIYHELIHNFMWLRNRSPFMQSQEGVPFARALLEGYATYLARSLADGDDGDTHLYARGAYRRPYWGKRQSLDPAKAEVDDNPTHGMEASNVTGLTALAAPDIFPEVAVTLQERHHYDVGMVWARALWAVRHTLQEKHGQEIGSIKADQLVLDAYQRLVGWVVSFEAAAEALIEIARDRQDIDEQTIGEIIHAFAAHGILAERSVQTAHMALDAQNRPIWLAGLDSGLYFAVDDGVTDLTQRQNWIPVSGPIGEPLRGITALSPNGNNPMPIATEQAVYEWSPQNPTAPARELGSWPAGERPARLLKYSGRTFVGSRHGIHLLQGSNWRAWNPNNNRFDGVCLDLVGMTLIDANAIPHDVCCVASFGELCLSPMGAQPVWERPSLPNIHCVCLAANGQDLFIGDYNGKVHRLRLQFDQVQQTVTPVGGPQALPEGAMRKAIVLRLACDNSSGTMYAGTTDGVFTIDLNNIAAGWQRLPEIAVGSVITALTWVGNTLVVGTSSSELSLRKPANNWSAILLE